MAIFIILLIVQAAVAYFTATVFFDVLHYFLHHALDSKIPVFKKIANAHLSHHRFYSSALKTHDEWHQKNLQHHVLMEYSIHVFVIALFFLCFHPKAVCLALLFETCIFVGVVYCGGKDAHHKVYSALPSYRGGFFVSGEYHAMHHLHPTKFFSSSIKVFDCIFGTAYHLKGKTILMTGANGALGSQMKILLEKEGAKVFTAKYGVDYDYSYYDGLKEILSRVDILFLCHGSKFENAEEANCDSFISIIELFKEVHKHSKEPLEIWAVGSEIECHPCFGIKKIKVYAQSKRNYAKYARELYRDRHFQYRHFVHSAFISPMGPGLMTASFAAKMSMFFLKRGFRYIPVTYTGFAWLNYFRFLLKF